MLNTSLVLRHHDVLVFVDVFQYSNHYESTPLAAALLSGSHPKLLNAAFHFAIRQNLNASQQPSNAMAGKQRFISSEDESRTTIASNTEDGNHQYSLSSSPHVVSSPKLSSSQQGRSFANDSQKKLSSLSENTSVQDSSNPMEETLQRQRSLAHLYCACNRNMSLGDFLIDLVSKSSSWRNILEMIDLRRLIIFGIIHGLIVRIHDYPLAIRKSEEAKKSQNAGSSIDSTHLNKIIDSMNGTTRDDELCCLNELPLNKLIDLVKTNEFFDVDIVHIYSSQPPYV